MSFDSLGLSDSLLQAVQSQGYDKPSPIQEQAIPAILQGRDIMAAAQTGTGKTAGFTLPMLQLLSKTDKRPRANQVRALVLTPTRELAAQVSESVEKYGANLPLKSAVVFGGVKINPQMVKLRKGVDVLVATPGRLLDLHTKNALKLDQVELFVLDEADRMLDMGFINDIKKVIALLPKRRQNLLFSATFSPDIRQLAKGLINDPIEVSVAPANTTAKSVEQLIVPVDKSDKTKALIKLVKDEQWYQVLIFCRTKHGANKLALQLTKAGISAAPIHGNKSQGARTRALAEFKKGDIQALVATDIAARGIDINELPQVVNFDLPHVSEDYVHRIGRTGRASASGKAVSLVCAAEQKELFGIERLIQEVIPRKEVSGFSPREKLADSPTTFKPIKAKKPKKNTSSGNASNSGKASDKRSAPRKPQRSGNTSKQDGNKGGNNSSTNNGNDRGNSSGSKTGGQSSNKGNKVNQDVWGGTSSGGDKSNAQRTTSGNKSGNNAGRANNDSRPAKQRSPRRRPSND